MNTIKGLQLRTQLLEETKSMIPNGVTPRLDIIFIGNDPASDTYVNKKKEAGESIGVTVTIHTFDTATTEEIASLVTDLSVNPDVHGIIVQLPAPGIDTDAVFTKIAPEKDVDALNPISLGNLWHGKHALVPATPAAVMYALEFIAKDAGDSLKTYLEGKDVLVINRSIILGKPLAALLLENNATVTIAHSRTKDLNSQVLKSDIVISGTGQPGLVTGEYVKDGAVLIDVGFNKDNGKIAGDIAKDSVDHAQWLSPVPGGIGPLGVGMLIRNTVIAANQLSSI